MAAAELLPGASAGDLSHLAAPIPVPVDAFGPARAYVEVVRRLERLAAEAGAGRP